MCNLLFIFISNVLGHILCLTCSFLVFCFKCSIISFRSPHLCHMFLLVSHVGWSCVHVLSTSSAQRSLPQVLSSRLPVCAMGWTKAKAMPPPEELEKLSWWDVIAYPQLIIFLHADHVIIIIIIIIIIIFIIIIGLVQRKTGQGLDHRHH